MANENMAAAITEAATASITGKKWYFSKTFWANVVAGVALSVQAKYGFVVPPEYQAIGLSLINVALRKITKEPVVW